MTALCCAASALLRGKHSATTPAWQSDSLTPSCVTLSGNVEVGCGPTVPRFDQPDANSSPYLTSPRSEEDILADLRTLCSSRGYIHALARICLDNDWLRLSKESGPEDYSHLYDDNHLTLTEVATLTLLLASHSVDLTHPGMAILTEYIQSTHRLLRELHSSLRQPFIRYGRALMAAPGNAVPPLPGPAFREPYFYTAPTAHYYQYRDFAVERYTNDDRWLSSSHGVTIKECHSVLSALASLQERKFTLCVATGDTRDTAALECLSFDIDELVQASGIKASTISAALEPFTCPEPTHVLRLSSASDFNIVTAQPILRLPNSRYVLFQFYLVFESLYVSPAYWMQSDPGYRDTAAQNRGAAAETLTANMMERVFGSGHVHRNVLVYQGQHQLGEIDVLAVHGDRAVTIETKSKRLTISARQGQRAAIENDFAKTIQQAYDQVYRCSNAILDPQTRLLNGDGSTVALRCQPTEVYPVCVSAEHYPALSFQVRHFLVTQHSKNVRAPLILDVFSLDTVTEFLSSPLRFLSYLDLRALHGDRVQGTTELSLLSLHLHQNLWPMIEGGATLVQDDMCAAVDAAMNTRRLGAPGPETPPGVLTLLRGTPIGEILDALDEYPASATIDLGLSILKGNGASLQRANSHIAGVLDRATDEMTLRHATICSPGESVGLTVQCVPPMLTGDMALLGGSCQRHKYKMHVDKWVGIEMRRGFLVAHVLPLHYPWVPDPALDQANRVMDERAHLVETAASGVLRKIGRNDPCPCGSGKKFKRCCGP